MIINQNTLLREMSNIMPIVSLTDVDILKECSKFSMPERIRGLKIVRFSDVSFRNLIWLWDIAGPEQMMIALAEVFFYPNLPAWRKWLNKDSEKWAIRWFPGCPLIDFYRFAYEMKENIRHAGDDFANMRIDLSEEEKQAGYGSPDPESTRKMIDSFARRQRISSLEEASDYSWAVYRFVFKVDIDEANRQRKYNKILQKPKK
jgi:hypothetical protein